MTDEKQAGDPGQSDRVINTGSRVDLFIVDDPYKNKTEAFSATHRKNVEEWFESVELHFEDK